MNERMKERTKKDYLIRPDSREIAHNGLVTSYPSQEAFLKAIRDIAGPEPEQKTEFTKKGTWASIDEETGEYVNSSYIEDGRYRFYLRFIQHNWVPCEKCQAELHQLITKSNKLILGNNDYYPPIELSRAWDIDDKTWKEIERRKPTLEEFKKHHRAEYNTPWEPAYEEYKEKFGELQ